MKEKNFQTLLGQYLVSHPPASAESYELKLSKGPSIRIDAVKPHQIAGLRGSTAGLYHRIYDQPWLAKGFQPEKPFDCMWLKGMRGYVLIMFYKPRKEKLFYKIPVNIWVNETIKVAKKSVREEEIKSWPSVEIVSLHRQNIIKS